MVGDGRVNRDTVVGVENIGAELTSRKLY